jgi:hypothetical protein
MINDVVIAETKVGEHGGVERNSEGRDGEGENMEDQEQGVDINRMSAHPKERAVIIRLFVVKHDR